LAVERGDVHAARDDLRAALRCLTRIHASSGPVVGLAAEHLPEADLGPLWALLAGPLLANDATARAHASLAAAILARRFEGTEAARALARSVAAAYRTIGYPLFEAWAFEVAGDSVAARAIYVRCGAAGDVRRIDARGGAAPSAPVSRLSEREEAVARAIAGGATNAQIAAALSISIRTVEKHVAAIFFKLGLRSRSQIAAAFARDS
jgi:DNA-binding NarL/FixJ family response regulator